MKKALIVVLTLVVLAFAGVFGFVYSENDRFSALSDDEKIIEILAVMIKGEPYHYLAEYLTRTTYVTNAAKFKKMPKEKRIRLMKTAIQGWDEFSWKLYSKLEDDKYRGAYSYPELPVADKIKKLARVIKSGDYELWELYSALEDGTYKNAFYFLDMPKEKQLEEIADVIRKQDAFRWRLYDELDKGRYKDTLKFPTLSDEGKAIEIFEVIKKGDEFKWAIYKEVVGENEIREKFAKPVKDLLDTGYVRGLIKHDGRGKAPIGVGEFINNAVADRKMDVLRIIWDLGLGGIYHASEAENNNNTLHFAIEHGDIDAIKFLLDNGVYNDERNLSGYTPLHWGVINYKLDNIAALKLFIERGANLNNRENIHGETVLYSAVFIGRRMDLIRALVEGGANLDAQMSHGNTALIAAAMHGNMEALTYLLENGAGADFIGSGNKTALIWANDRGYMEMVNLLSAVTLTTPKIFENNISENYTLHEAAAEGDVEIVERLLGSYIPINKKDNEGNTALHYAARNNRPDLVELLISRGADVFIKNNDGHNAVTIATEYGAAEAVKKLLEFGPKEAINSRHDKKGGLLHIAVSSNNAPYINYEKMINLLISAGIDINNIDEELGTPIYQSISHGKFDMAKLLKEKGADINTGNKPVIFAVSNANDLAIMEKVINLGADINAKNDLGETVLVMAVKNNDIKLANFFILSGSDPDIEDHYGKTARDYAEDKGITDSLKF